MERLFEALEESRSARGNKGAGEKNRKRELKVNKHLDNVIFINHYHFKAYQFIDNRLH